MGQNERVNDLKLDNIRLFSIISYLTRVVFIKNGIRNMFFLHVVVGILGLFSELFEC